MRFAFPRSVPLAATVLLFLIAIPASANTYTTTGVQQASGTPSPPATGDSPFASCDISSYLFPGETNYVNSELEPWVAVNPTDPNNIIGVYQQDRFSFGGARGLVAAVTHDGGDTWTATYPHFSFCAGGTAANEGDLQRASDPWVTFAPNGDAYFASLSLNFVGDPSTTGSAILVSRSTDGGDTWSEPTTLIRDLADVTPFYLNDKESITADPFDANYVYAVWDRLRKTGNAQSPSAENSWAFRGDTLFSRTTDGGATWEEPKVILQTSKLTGASGNQIAVLPDGTLVDIFVLYQGSGKNNPGSDIQIQRSTDKGATWSAPVVQVAPARPVEPVDPDTGRPVRAGSSLPDIAVDMTSTSPGYGNVYAVWGDSLGSGSGSNRHTTVVFTESTDGGLTWSPLSRIDRSGAVPAFTPSVHVASDGTVGVTYYDFRNNTPDPGVPTDQWFLHCHPSVDCVDPASWAETHVAGPFDIEQAPFARGYFLGDYDGLDSIGTSFISFFSETTSTDPDNTYMATIASP
jgi:hypothetical protein